MYASASQERQEGGEEGRAGAMGEGKLRRCHPPETYSGTHVWSRTKEGWRAGQRERRRGVARGDERPQDATGDQSSRLMWRKYATRGQQSVFGFSWLPGGHSSSSSPTILKTNERLT